jgi:hypothetical protein
MRGLVYSRVHVHGFTFGRRHRNGMGLAAPSRRQIGDLTEAFSFVVTTGPDEHHDAKDSDDSRHHGDRDN